MATRHGGGGLAQWLGWVLSPGVGPALLMTFNVTVVVLLLCLAAMSLDDLVSFHAPFLLFIVTMLLIAVNWYYAVSRRLEREARETRKKGDKEK